MSYDPGVTPKDPAQLISFLNIELLKIRDSINSVNYYPLSIRNAAPNKPRTGLYAADGVNWNPGAGAGVYFYNGSTYAKL